MQRAAAGPKRWRDGKGATYAAALGAALAISLLLGIAAVEFNYLVLFVCYLVLFIVAAFVIDRVGVSGLIGYLINISLGSIALLTIIMIISTLIGLPLGPGGFSLEVASHDSIWIKDYEVELRPIEDNRFSGREFIVVEFYEGQDWRLLGLPPIINRHGREDMGSNMRRDPIGTDTIHAELAPLRLGSQRRGLLVREIVFYPPLAEYDDESVLTQRGDTLHVGPISRSGRVRISDIPTGSFVSIRGGVDVQLSRHLGHEAVSATVDRIDDGISVAYLPPALAPFRSMLTPFIGITNLGNGVILIMAFVVVSLVGPVVIDLVKDWIKARLVSRSAKKVGTSEHK